MKFFDNNLSPDNKNSFTDFVKEYNLSKFRKYVYKYIITQDKGGLDLINKSFINDELIEIIREELKNLGWKTVIAYGETTLFIYQNDDEIIQLEGMIDI